MKPALLFLIKFVCLTVPFVWLWRNGGLSFYYALYNPVAEAVYAWLGFEGVEAPARDRYINMIPFLALMVLTPNLSIRRRLGGIAIGLAVLFTMHIAVNLAAYPKTLLLPRPVSLALDAAPFFLWIIIANEFIRDFMKWGDPNANAEDSAGTDGD
jgi:hypothetical protein